MPHSVATYHSPHLGKGAHRLTRLRYPFAQIGLRCRLCNETTYMDTSGGRVGARMIDWRRRHAGVCPEWRRWAAEKGLTVDENGALLYPGEVGPYQPRSSVQPADDDEADLLDLPDDAFAQHVLI